MIHNRSLSFKFESFRRVETNRVSRDAIYVSKIRRPQFAHVQMIAGPRFTYRYDFDLFQKSLVLKFFFFLTQTAFAGTSIGHIGLIFYDS